MNKKCPKCACRLARPEVRRLTTWRWTRRAVGCPNCGTLLLWERRSYLRFSSGLCLAGISAALLFGVLLAPCVRGLLGRGPAVSVLEAVTVPADPIQVVLLPARGP